MQRTLERAVEIMDGELLSGDPSRVWDGAALDSRRIVGGELFFALVGEHTDGHHFVTAALDHGAAAAVVTRAAQAGPDQALIRVPDAFVALHDLTRAVREETPRRLVGITGSVGKTSTKEILATLLARRYRTSRSPGNLNNLYGFPLALLGIAPDTEWMVAEMGMSTPGELSGVSRLGRPDVAVFLNVKPAHLEQFGSLAKIASAKAELLDGLVPGGTVVANSEDARVVEIANGHQGRVVFFGEGPGPGVRALDVQPRPGGLPGYRFDLFAEGVRQEVCLPLYGRYTVSNFLAAAATAWAIGLPLSLIATGATDLEGAPGRGVVNRLWDEIVLVDDTYNSSPEALRAALESASGQPAKRRWAVLGEMLELGEGAPEFHREAGALAADLGFSPVVGVGSHARHLVEAARAGGSEGHWFESAPDALETVLKEVEAGDLLLVKGSRGVGLERVVNAVLGSRVPWGKRPWRRVLVYGLGASGQAAARLLRHYGVEVLACDRRASIPSLSEELKGDAGIHMELGAEPSSLPRNVDAVVLSPGVPLDRPLLGAARSAGVPVVAEVELAYPCLMGPVAGITGTNGKSTTTALTGALLEASGLRPEVCGNIGDPLADGCQGPADRIFVVELSSFQLETIHSFRARWGALLNIADDHLDRHGSVEEYLAAKARLFENQKEDDVAVLNADDPRVAALATPGRRRFFSRLRTVADGCFLTGEAVVERAPGRPDRKLFSVSDLRLTGIHNLENAMAAVLLALAAGGDPGVFPSVLKEFSGLRHRMERVAEIDGVVYINDSKGTNPAASSMSLSGFPAGSVHLILGGRGKGLGFSELAVIAGDRAARVYLIGETAEELERVLDNRVEVERAGKLERAVRQAAKLARPGETVLLSPACASFDQYTSFGERGDHFVSLVEELEGQRG